MTDLPRTLPGAIHSAPKGLDLPPSALVVLEAAYASPGRHYHGPAHIEETIRWFGVVAQEVGWAHPHEVFVALLFHDAVYVPGASDNETHSAELALATLKTWSASPPIDPARVDRLIRLTAEHGGLKPADVDPEDALFLDCDMAILGSSPAEFALYEAGIAAEYRHLPPEAFQHGRRKFLERLIASPRIFLSDFFHQRMDAPAQINLNGALTSLSA